MLKVVVKFIQQGRAEEFYGHEAAVRDWLRQQFAEARPFHKLDDVVRAINEFGDAEVEVAPYQAPREQNLLPEDYQTHQESEDPWPREG
jgi:hypothetical protein